MYTYEDGGVLHGTYVDGELNGPAQEFDGEGRLVFKGQYKDNTRCGECWVYYPVSQLSAHCNTLVMFTCMKHPQGYISTSTSEAIFRSIYTEQSGCSAWVLHIQNVVEVK